MNKERFEYIISLLNLDMLREYFKCDNLMLVYPQPTREFIISTSHKGSDAFFVNLTPGSRFPQICSICGKTYMTSFIDLYGKLYGRATRKKWLQEKVICKDVVCRRLKTGMVNDLRASLGESPAQGHVVTKAQSKKRLKTIRERNSFKEWNEFRKGKTVEEIHGEEKGKQIRETCAPKTIRTGADHAFFGKHHTKKTRKHLSKKTKDFIERERGNKVHISPLTGDKVDIIDLVEDKKKIWRANRTEDEKLATVAKMLASNLNKNKPWNRRKDIPPILNHLTGKKEYMDSNLEALCGCWMNREKLYWKKNLSIYIPYEHPTKGKTYYVPDFVIYKDKERSKILEIWEVKPFEFQVNLRGLTSEYYEIVKRKNSAAMEYCDSKGFRFRVITEMELGFYPDGLNRYMNKEHKGVYTYEDKKGYKDKNRAATEDLLLFRAGSKRMRCGGKKWKISV